MNNTADGREILETVDERIHLCFAHDIAAPHNDLDIQSRQFVDKFLDLAGNRPAPRDEHNRLCALGCHPPRHASAQTARSTDQQIRCVGAKERLQLLGRNRLRCVSFAREERIPLHIP